MRNAGAADHTYVVAIILRFIILLAAGIQLACWIAALWQWSVGAEDPRFEGAKLIYRA
jgi:hypothetical protein